MRWRAERDVLRDAVEVARTPAGKAHLAVLNSLHLAATEDGSLTVRGSDLDLTVTTSAKGSTEAAGAVAVPAVLLHGWLSKAPDGAVEVSEDERTGRVTLAAGSSSITINTPPITEWPRLDDVEGERFTIAPETWGKLRRLAVFPHVDTSRSISCVHFGPTGGWAANEHRAAWVRCDGLPEATIPRASFAAIAAHVKDGAVDLVVNEREAALSHDGVTWSCRLMHAQYPDMERLIPPDLPLSIDVDKAELVEAVDRLSLFGDSKIPPSVVLHLEDDAIRAETEGFDAGMGTEHVDAGLDVGDLTAVKFDGNYLRQIATTFPDDDRLVLRGKGGLKPWVVDSGNVLVLVMPVRLNR